MSLANKHVQVLRDQLPSPSTPRNILVVGAGNFGTCLADHLADLGNNVTIWARSQEVVDGINHNHRNPRYLKDTDLSSNLSACTEVTDEFVSALNVILFSIPTQNMRQIISQWKDRLNVNILIIFVNKGIETTSLLLPCDIVKEVWGETYAAQVVFLSGPSFAAEIVQRQPTCVSVASDSISHALRCQMLFHAPYFRVYDSTDVVGVELAGALKNVIAIASGACTGLGFTNNARAALITRGLAEITRLGVAMGANPLTFSGLAGVGDLFLTCTSEMSRNFKVGYRIGRGETLQHVLETLGSVAEGVETTRAAYQLYQKYNVESPICNELHAVLFDGKTLETAMKDLLMREAYSEFTLEVPYD